MVTRAHARTAFTALSLSLAILLVVPSLVSPPGREAFALEAAVASLLHGHSVALPDGATPGMVAIVACGEGLSSVPGRGVRILAALALLGLGPLATFAFGSPSRRAAPLTLAVASLASVWFGAVFVDFDAAARGQLFAHVACLAAIAVTGRAIGRRPHAGSTLAIVAFTMAVATSLRTLPYLPILFLLTRARATRRRALVVTAGALVLVAIVFAAFSRLAGASLFGSLDLAPSWSLGASVAELVLRFRPTGALVAVAAIIVCLRRDPRARVGTPFAGYESAYVILAVLSAVVPFADNGARLESMVPAFAIMAVVVARAYAGPHASAEPASPTADDGRPWPRLAGGIAVVLVVGAAATATSADSKSRGNRPTRRFLDRIGAVARALSSHDDVALLASHSSESRLFYPAEARSIGRFLEGVAPDATLRVLPNAPEVYRYAHLYPIARARLDVTTSATEALDEHPRWIVAPTGTPALPAYATRAAFPHYVVLEREGR